MTEVSLMNAETSRREKSYCRTSLIRCTGPFMLSLADKPIAAFRFTPQLQPEKTNADCADADQGGLRRGCHFPLRLLKIQIGCAKRPPEVETRSSYHLEHEAHTSPLHLPTVIWKLGHF